MPSPSLTSAAAGPRWLLAVAPLLFASVAASSGTPTTVVASTTATGTIAVTGTSLPDVVQETEPCAILCYEAACLDSGCPPGDFSCVCGNPHSLVVKMGICVGRDCNDARQFDSGDWMADMCDVFSKNPSGADISSASSILMAEISSAAVTATDNPVPSLESISVDSTAAATAGSTAASGTTASSSTRLSSPGLGSTFVGIFGATVVFAAFAL